MGRKENKCSGKNYGSFFPKQLSNLGPERNNTWAGHSAAILPEKPACLEAAIPDLDDSNNLLDRRPGGFFFFFLMTELFGYQQSISNFILCTVASYSTSFKFHFSWCHKKMEEQEIRIISFGVYLLTFIFKIWQPIHALDMSLWLFQVIQKDPCFLHLNKNQKLDIISIALLHIIASHQYAKLGREDAFHREPLNSEEKMVWFLVESGWS